MSLLADPPLLYADGEFYARVMPEGAQGGMATAVGALTVGVFWAVAAALWFDHPAVRPALKGYRSGREFMLRFPLSDRGRRRRRPRNTREDALAVAGLALYPFWWWLGWDRGRRSRPRGA
jgi:hypothetical protein